ncbi:MAG: ABC transporter permease [Trueperaceae bacterium]
MFRTVRMPRFLRRSLRSPRLAVGAIGLLIFLIVAIAPGAFTSQNPATQNLRARFQPPVWLEEGTAGNPLGTDRLGRDLWSRTLYASRVSITVGLSSVLISGLVGVALGVIAGYFSGLAGTIIMRIADVQLGIPPLLLVIAVAGILGPSLRNVIIILAISGWVIYARTARGLVLSLKENDFIQGARALGASHFRVIVKHLVPNILVPLTVIASQQMALMILRESTLSFLGIGVPPDIPTWGSMIADGRVVIEYAWWVSAIPGLALLTAVLCINFLGDGLRDVLDQRLRM